MRVKDSPITKRRRQWHGWAFMNYSPEKQAAIRRHIATGEWDEVQLGPRWSVPE